MSCTLSGFLVGSRKDSAVKVVYIISFISHKEALCSLWENTVAYLAEWCHKRTSEWIAAAKALMMLQRLLSVWLGFRSDQQGFCLGTFGLITLLLLMYTGGIQASLTMGPGGDLPRFSGTVSYLDPCNGVLVHLRRKIVVYIYYNSKSRFVLFALYSLHVK